MSKPVPGKKYIIEDETTLSQVSARAYGDGSLWPIIWKINQSELRSNDPNVIFPGEVIFIPLLSSRERLKLSVTGINFSAKDKAAVTIVLDGLEIIPQSANITRTMDTLSDGWACKFPWIPEEFPDLDTRIRFRSFTDASVYIGSTLMVKGRLYITIPDSAGASVTIKGAAYTKDIIDSTLRAEYQKENVTLLDRCKGLSEPFGINVTVAPGLDLGGQFDRVEAGQTEKVGDHLALLAKQRAVLLTSTRAGQLFITQTASGKPVATLEENKQGVGSFTASGDATRIFRHYKAISQTPAGEIEATAKDENVSAPRSITFSVNDVTEGNIQAAVDWERSKALAKALTFPIPVDTIFDPSGTLWEENTLVLVKSAYNFMSKGVILVIRSVDYNFGGNGDTAVLNVVPPQVFTGEPLEDIFS